VPVRLAPSNRRMLSLDPYTFTWRTPSTDSSGSMPLGNGETGVNLWVEESGDILFYISRTDAWSENARLLKLGRIRIHLDPPLTTAEGFRQTLDLRRGMIRILGGRDRIHVWVDAKNPVVRVEIVAARKKDLVVWFERWREKERILKGRELFSAFGLQRSPNSVVVSPDVLLPGQGNRVVWYHRNETSIWPMVMELQGMAGWAEEATDPLLGRTFGGMILGDTLESRGDGSLSSTGAKLHHVVSVHTHTSQAPGPGQWLEELDEVAGRSDSVPLDDARTAHEAWWKGFWGRSWIKIKAGRVSEIINRAYVLQRFLNACGGRGSFPIKFNGSIFTVDSREEGETFDVDYRRWGGPYWFQNTRLIYWPMLASGDFDLMGPLFRMYINALPLAESRTRLYFDHGGAFFPETMYFWGAYTPDDYGWDRGGKHMSYIDNPFIRHYWQGGLELLGIMLDYFAYTADGGFFRDSLLPMSRAILRFYDEHYRRDQSGHLHLHPAQALETFQKAANPAPDIAGLRWVLDRLLSLPEDTVPEEDVENWSRLRDETPPLPKGRIDGQEVLLPAEEVLEEARNSENPELYSVFPYRIFGLDKEGIDIARRSFSLRRYRGADGWRQDDVQAALLGLTEVAREYVAKRLSQSHPGSRFPAFWGPNYDWVPDQTHGCNGLMALQTMLLQTKGRKILLLPAWPKDWDVRFRLHAPHRTVVEGLYEDGVLKELKVTPPERRRDVTILTPPGRT